MVESAWDRRRRMISLDIEAIALGVFADQGFANTTVAQAATAAGVSESTFFRYFATKDDVLLAAPRRVSRRVCDAVLARPDGETLLASWRSALGEGSFLTPEDLRSAKLLGRIIAHSPDLAPRLATDSVNTELHVHTVATRLGIEATSLRAVVIAGAIHGALGAANGLWHSHPRGEEPTQLLLDALLVLEEIAEH